MWRKPPALKVCHLHSIGYLKVSHILGVPPAITSPRTAQCWDGARLRIRAGSRCLASSLVHKSSRTVSATIRRRLRDTRLLWILGACRMTGLPLGLPGLPSAKIATDGLSTVSSPKTALACSALTCLNSVKLCPKMEGGCLESNFHGENEN